MKAKIRREGDGEKGRKRGVERALKSRGGGRRGRGRREEQGRVRVKGGKEARDPKGKVGGSDRGAAGIRADGEVSLEGRGRKVGGRDRAESGIGGGGEGRESLWRGGYRRGEVVQKKIRSRGKNVRIKGSIKEGKKSQEE